MKSACAAGILALSLSQAAALQAQESVVPIEELQPGLVVLIYRAGDPFGVRLEAELRSIGMQVVTRRHLGALPEGTMAIATLIDGPPRRVELRIGSHPEPGSEPDAIVAVDADDEIASIRASEQVRAAFAPLALRVPAPAVSAPSSTALDPPPPRPPISSIEIAAIPRTSPAIVRLPSNPPTGIQFVAPRPLPPIGSAWFGLGIGLGGSVGGEGAALDTTASVFFRPLPWLRLEPFVQIPLLPITFEDRAGSADIFAGSTGARAALRVWDGIASLALGASVAGVWLRVEGDANQGYAGSSEDVFTAMAAADVSLRVHLAGPVWLAPRISLGLALPVDVVFDGVVVGTWGLPVGSLNLPVEVEWEL